MEKPTTHDGASSLHASEPAAQTDLHDKETVVEADESATSAQGLKGDDEPGAATTTIKHIVPLWVVIDSKLDFSVDASASY